MRLIIKLLLTTLAALPVQGDCEKHFFNFGQILKGYNGIKGNPNSLDETDPGEKEISGQVPKNHYVIHLFSPQDSRTRSLRQFSWTTRLLTENIVFLLESLFTIVKVRAMSNRPTSENRRKLNHFHQVYYDIFRLLSQCRVELGPGNSRDPEIPGKLVIFKIPVSREMKESGKI